MKPNKAAQILGRLGKGIPKNYSIAERMRRADRMRKVNETRNSKKGKSNV